MQKRREELYNIRMAVGRRLFRWHAPSSIRTIRGVAGGHNNPPHGTPPKKFVYGRGVGGSGAGLQPRVQAGSRPGPDQVWAGPGEVWAGTPLVPLRLARPHWNLGGGGGGGGGARSGFGTGGPPGGFDDDVMITCDRWVHGNAVPLWPTRRQAGYSRSSIGAAHI